MIKELPIVLLVEDNPDLRLVIKYELEGEFEVVVVPNGKVAFSMLQQTIPDLIISDIMMPEMDGLELCRLVKTSQRTRQVPVILLTARTTTQDQITGLEEGADDYVTKPFEMELLKARARNLIQSRRLFRSETAASLSSRDPFIDRVSHEIEERLSDPGFGVEQLADAMHVNRTTLLSRIKEATGLPPRDLIRLERLKIAERLLKESDLTVAEVAVEIGIPEPANFSRVFKQEYGVPPSQFRSSSD